MWEELEGNGVALWRFLKGMKSVRGGRGPGLIKLDEPNHLWDLY